jgi:hypothetical protein
MHEQGSSSSSEAVVPVGTTLYVEEEGMINVGNGATKYDLLDSTAS